MRNILKCVVLAAFLAAGTGGMSAQTNPLKGIGGPENAATQLPIRWSGVSETISDTECTVTLTATMDEGWHLYGMTMPEGGPEATRITFVYPENVKTVGKLTVDKAPMKRHDEMFDADLEFWSGTVKFKRTFKLENGVSDATVKCTVRFMGCNDETCRPPQTTELRIKLK